MAKAQCTTRPLRDLVARAFNSTVYIQVPIEGPPIDGLPPVHDGAGVAVTQDLVLTCAHLWHEGAIVRLGPVAVAPDTAWSGDVVDQKVTAKAGKLIAQDEAVDLALVSVPDLGAVPISIAGVDDAQTGDDTFFIGHPHRPGSPIVSSAIISARLVDLWTGPGERCSSSIAVLRRAIAEGPSSHAQQEI
jgi:S1-C subfamily serine protease